MISAVNRLFFVAWTAADQSAAPLQHTACYRSGFQPAIQRSPDDPQRYRWSLPGNRTVSAAKSFWASDSCADLQGKFCRAFTITEIFHEKTGCGVIDYFCRLKIETAQKMIRQKRYNYTQISDMLGYSSYQYFSLQFKKFTRMTPSEYASSVKNFSGTE